MTHKETKKEKVTLSSVDLTGGKVWKKLIQFFIPVAAGTVVQQMYNTADALIVGKYVGTDALAAVGGSSAMIVNIVIGVLVALTSGASVVVAHYYGEKNSSSVQKSTNSEFLSVAVTGAAVTVIGIWLTPAFLKIMKTPENTVADATIYLRILFGATIFVALYNMGAGILRASGDSRRPFIYLLVCCAANIGLDWLFVAIFHWGVAGAAIATAASQLTEFLLVLRRMITADEDYRLDIKHIKIDKYNLKRMLYLGIPAALQSSMYSISNALIQVGVNSLGTATVAAWALTGKIDGIYWALISAMGTAIMTFTGQNYGAGKIDRIKECAKWGMIMTVSGTVCMSALILITAPYLVPFFDDNPEVVELTVYMFYQFVPYYFLWPAIEVYSGILRGAGDAVVPVVILGITVCLYRVIWMYTAFEIVHTLFMLCVCYPISWLAASIPLYIRYRRGKWNHILP